MGTVRWNIIAWAAAMNTRKSPVLDVVQKWKKSDRNYVDYLGFVQYRTSQIISPKWCFLGVLYHLSIMDCKWHYLAWLVQLVNFHIEKIRCQMFLSFLSMLPYDVLCVRSSIPQKYYCIMVDLATGAILLCIYCWTTLQLIHFSIHATSIKYWKFFFTKNNTSFNW